MGYRLFDFSSDVGIEADGPSVTSALAELGRGLSRVLTDTSHILRSESKPLDVTGPSDWPGAAVAFLNELVFLFDTEQFLVADANLRATKDADRIRIHGTVLGETFDAARHGSGRGVKAATLHDASYTVEDGVHRFRIVLDL